MLKKNAVNPLLKQQVLDNTPVYNEYEDKDYFEQYDEYEDEYNDEDEYFHEVTLTSVNIIVNSAVVLFVTVQSSPQTFTFYPTSVNYAKAKQLAFDKLENPHFTADEIKTLADWSNIKKALTSWAQGKLQIQGENVLFDGEALPETLNHFILTQFETSGDFNNFIKPWTNFIEKLRQVQSLEVYNTLHNFLKHNDLTINEDGDVLAYKVINTDWTDKYTGKIDNSLGQVVTMDRRAISSNPEQTCSYGLHVCSLDYLRNCYANVGDRLVQVTVDVRNIVVIPSDYKGTKVRCCEYKVIKDLGFWGTDVI